MTPTNTPIQNLLVIDSSVKDSQSLAAGVGTDTSVLILDSRSDGLTQISAYLSNSAYAPLQSLQIISHGSAGSLQLGSSTITTSTLKSYTKQLTAIGSYLTATADILLYGCDVATGQSGLEFIKQFAALTSADVAASNDITGSAALGGNWLLEANTGNIEAVLSLKHSYFNAYTSILSSDTTAPTLTSLTFPTTINLSSGNQSVSFAAHAEDAGSGVDTVNVWFDKSLTTDIGSYNLWMISSGWTDSTPSDASVGRTVQSYNNPGTYNITKVDVKDLAGNSRSYTTAQLSSLGIATSFNVTGSNGDTTAPTLTSLTFPTTINLSSGNQSVSFAAHAEDAGSGVDTVNVWFDKSLTTDIGSYNLWMISSGWTDSTPSDASVGRTVQSYNNPGIYNITRVDVKDLAGNSRSYSSLGIASSFNVTDGVSIPNALTATPSIEQGKIIISLSAAQWSASSNSLAFTLAYDSSVVHFDSWRAGSSGSYSVSSSILEVGTNASVSMTGSINNSGNKTDFLQLVFTTTAQQGSFAYNFSSGTLNSQTLANVSGNYLFSGVDAIAPFVSIFNPADEATDIAISSNIVLTFSEAIKKGTGTIAIHTGSATGTVIESFDATSSNRLTIAGNTLTIDPTNNLANNTHYFVTFASGTAKDLAGNNYAGTTTYDFYTLANTTVTLSPNSTYTAQPNQTINGTSGVNKVVFSEPASNFTVSLSGSTATLVDKVGTFGTETLNNVQRAVFNDGFLALDFQPGQNCHLTAMMIGTAFGASKVSAYFAAGVSLYDAGQTNLQVATLIQQLGLIESQIGSTSNKAWVDFVYKNVVGVAADTASEATFVNALNNSTYTKASLLALAAGVADSGGGTLATQINLVGLQAHGLSYHP